MWCNYIPESIVIPMMMTVTNYSSIVTGNPFLSFNDFFPWLESSSYFREGHRRSWLMNFKWMNFIFTRPKMAIGNSEAPLFASNLFSFYYPCQPPTTNWNWKLKRIQWVGNRLSRAVFSLRGVPPIRGFTWNSSWYPKMWNWICHHFGHSQITIIWTWWNFNHDSPMFASYPKN